MYRLNQHSIYDAHIGLKVIIDLALGNSIIMEYYGVYIGMPVTYIHCPYEGQCM